LNVINFQITFDFVLNFLSGSGSGFLHFARIYFDGEAKKYIPEFIFTEINFSVIIT